MGITNIDIHNPPNPPMFGALPLSDNSIYKLGVGLWKQVGLFFLFKSLNYVTLPNYSQFVQVQIMFGLALFRAILQLLHPTSAYYYLRSLYSLC